MFKLMTLILLPLLILCSSCTKENTTPFHLDASTASYSVFANSSSPGASGIEVNGENVLRGALIFPEKEQLLAIRSLGKLDVIMQFSGDSIQGSIQITLHNQGKEELSVNQLSMLQLQFDDVAELKLVGEKEVQITGFRKTGVDLHLREDTTSPWALKFDVEEEMLTCRLQLSKASITLLPGEELSLPQLEFFYHLCAE